MPTDTTPAHLYIHNPISINIQTHKSTNTLSAIPISKATPKIRNQIEETNEPEIKSRMSAAKCSKAWIVATSVGAVEALKDQGFCRWNHAIRSIHHNARNSVNRSIIQAKNTLSSSVRGEESAPAINQPSNGRLQQSEESMRKVMFLSSWATN